MLDGVDRVLLRVPTLAAGVRYYGEVLGLRLLRREGHAAAFALGEAELVLHDSPDLPAMEVSFKASGLRRAHGEREKLKLTFKSPPRPTGRGLRASVRDAFGHVWHLVERTPGAAGSDAPGASDDRAGPAPAGGSPAVPVGMPAGLFGGSDVVEEQVKPKPELLVRLYQTAGRTADDLPYTHHFELIYDGYAAAFERPPERSVVWTHLLRLRKAGKLPPMGRSRSRPPRLAAEEREVVRTLLGPAMGRRDRLPYTPELEALRDAFERRTKRRLSPHQFWRVIATLAK
ncbi:MAG: VOC family protein [Tepidisphaerales bacterium]